MIDILSVKVKTPTGVKIIPIEVIKTLIAQYIENEQISPKPPKPKPPKKEQIFRSLL